MTCFTTTTTIPSGSLKVFTALVDDHIWILFDSPKRIYKYNTDTFHLEAVKCVFPEFLEGHLVHFVGGQNFIYAIVATKLVKFNVNTLMWNLVMYLSINKNLKSFGPIIGNYLYFFKPTHEDATKKRLLKLNLQSKKTQRISVFEISDVNCLKIMENNGEVYVKEERFHNRSVVVWKIGNGEKEMVNTYYFDTVDGNTMIKVNWPQVQNGFVLKVQQRIGQEDDLKANTIYLEMFDFTTNKWKQTVFPGFVRENTDCVDKFFIKGNKMFAMFKERSNGAKYSIQMIEICPTLSTICMKSQIEKTNNAKDFESVEANLSISSRLKLNNMLDWKIPELTKQLKEKQKSDTVQEVLKMASDGTVDHRMHRKLQDVFDSDFSDESGSDITDFKMERHESSEDDGLTDGFNPHRRELPGRFDERVEYDSDE